MMLLSAVLAFAALVSGIAAPSVFSPADAAITSARANVKAKPASASPYIELAAALCRKGRDREDPAIYREAEAAAQQALHLSKENYEARKIQVTILVGKHEFAQALQLAKELNRKVPDDITGWASLSEIDIALGHYAEAEKQAQWVLDLRPGYVLGFEKAAALREVFGDVPGAIEFLDEANRRTPVNDSLQRAWLLTGKARLQLVAGYPKEAETTLQQALLLFPDSQRALEVLAHIRLAQGRAAEGTELLQRRYEAVTTAANLYDWASAVENESEAAQLFQRFEAQALAETAQPFNANLQLAFFYLNRKKDAAAALALTARMAQQRQDNATLDAYAWALYCSGRYAEAKTQMDRAMAVGSQDALYVAHAAQISAKLALQESR